MRFLAIATLALVSVPAMAQIEEDTYEEEGSYDPRFSLSGFGEFGVSGRNYTGNRFSTNNGAEADNSAVFTVPAIGFRLDYKANKYITLSSEAEYISNSRIQLDKLALNYSFCPEFNLAGGIFTLPIGHSNAGYGFTDFFTTGRPEGENAIMPTPFTECGVSLSGKFDFGLDYQATISTGANAQNFTAEDFVKGSQQGFLSSEGKLESPATTLRLGYSGVKGLRLGAGIYYCPNTARNMAIYSDFKGFYSPERDIPLTIYYADAQYVHDWFTLRGSFMEGNMGNSYFLANYFYTSILDGTITGLKYDGGIIAKIARTYMGEVGINIKNILYPGTNGLDIIPFVHYEYYNSQEQGQTKSLVMDSRGKVRMMSFGVNWHPTEGVVLKCNYTTRKTGEAAAGYNSMNEINIGLAYDLSLLEL